MQLTMLLLSSWWMWGLLHCYWFPIHHHKYTVRDITEGRRDPGGRDDEEESDGWKDGAMMEVPHGKSSEDHTGCKEKLWKKRRMPNLSTNCHYPAAKANDTQAAEFGPSRATNPLWCSDHLWGLQNVKQKRRKGDVCFQFNLPLTATLNRKTMMVGRKQRKGTRGTTAGRQQIMFPSGNTTVAEREDREKWGRGEEGWACCQLKILVILTHTFWIPRWLRLVNMMPLWFMIAKPASL